MKTAQTTLCSERCLRFFLYNTACEIRVDAPAREALEGALGQAQRVQAMLDVYDPGSELSAVNSAPAGTPVPVGPELFALLAELARAHRVSGGVFDATLGPVIRLWNFAGGGDVPAPTTLERALALAGFRQLRLDAQTRTVAKASSGAGIDAGGAGKGYAVGCIRDHLLHCGVQSATINLGGNLCLLGGAMRRVGVQKPWSPRGEALGSLELPACSVSTSSGYERFFLRGGALYHHLLDPRTGYPAQSDVVSATVVSGSPLWGDILSTVFLVGGEQAGIDAMQALQLPEMQGYLLVTANGEIRLSPELAPYFTPFSGIQSSDEHHAATK